MMISKELLLDLVNHMEWADARVWETALAHEAARVDPALRDNVLHLHTVQRAFLSAWSSQPFTLPETFDDTTLAGECDSVRAYYEPARAFVSGLDAQRLETPWGPPWTKWFEQVLGRPPAPTTLGETILQVCMHSAHHRAQANARLRAVGAEPQVIDYIAWLWLGRPVPAWPMTTG